MKNANIQHRNSVVSLVSALLVKYIVPIKLSYIVGSSLAFFSLSSCAFPLIGSFNTTLVTILFFMGISLFRFLLSPISALHVLAYYVPGLCAALSLRHNSIFFKIVLPLCCMALFVWHPVGRLAWQYSMFWWIPVIIYVMGYASFFVQSLSATFIAHAVGSVFWIYALPMTPAVWLALIPLVVLERVAIACGMVALQVLYCSVSFYTVHYTCQPQRLYKSFAKEII